MCKTSSGSACSHATFKALGLLALRLAVGFIFVYQGYSKLVPNHAGAVKMFENMGLFGGGELWAYLIGGLELLGGLMVALGIFVRYASVWLSAIMVVAMVTVHRGGPIFGYFLPLSMLGSNLALMGIGAGKFRLVKTQCHCKECKESAKAGCCGGGKCGSAEPVMKEETLTK